MNKNLIIPGLVAASLNSFSYGSNVPNEHQESHKGKQPNIIFIYTDDMGYADLSCYGSQINRTPNLDQMAKDGIQFTNLYSASPLSSPSRAALLTGRYPNRMGIGGVFFPGSPSGLPTEEITMAKALRDAGYRTGIIGKWHLGSRDKYLPLQHGFDEYFGTPYSNDMVPNIFIEGNEFTNRITNQDSLTYIYTQRAREFISRNKEKPFFLYLAHNMPHVPLGASPAFKGKSPNGLYSDVIEELDWGVNEVLKELEKHGLDENTIVIFSSDNGPWLSEGPFGGKATPYFQGKNTNWEGGQKVPGIIRWKGKIKPNQVKTDVINMLDWFPTLVTLGGGQVPDDRIIDGENITQLLLGTGRKKNEDFIYLDQHSKLMGVRSGDWKILLPEDEKVGNYWEADVPAHDTILINLKKDIAEQVDLKDTHRKEFGMMKEKLAKAKESMKNCPPSQFLFEVRTMIIQNMQHNGNILRANGKGIEPKSEAGQAEIEAIKGGQKQGQYMMKKKYPF